MVGSAASSPKDSNARNITALDGGRGWIVVFAALVFNIIYDGCSFSFGIFFIEILKEFNETKSNTAWIGSLFFSMPLLLAPLAGLVTRKVGSRMATMFGGLVAATGFAIGSFSSSLPLLVISYGLIGGIGMSLPYFNSFKTVTDYFDKRLALASGIAECGAGLGTLIFAPLTEYLVSTYGWRGALLITSGIVSNIIICGALFCPISQNKCGTIKAESYISNWSIKRRLRSFLTKATIKHPVEDASNDHRNKSDTKVRRLYLNHMKNMRFLMFAISNFTMYFWYNVPYIFIVANAVDIGSSLQKASKLLLIIGLVHLFGIIGHGVLCNQKWVNITMIYGTSTGMCGVSILLVPVFQEYISLAVLSGCFGLFSAATEALFSCFLIDIVGKEAFDNFFCGFILFLEGAANLLGPPFAGFLVDCTGSYDATFYAAGACVTAASCLFLTFSRRRTEKTDCDVTIQT